MNIKVVSDKSKTIPEIGDLWRYRGDDTVWMRVNEARVKKGFPDVSDLASFFSVCLGSSGGGYKAGEIYYSTPTDKVEILKQLNTLEVAAV